MYSLGLFAKFWSPGRVKTRLAVSIGDERAAAVQHACLHYLARSLAASLDRRQIVFWPIESGDAFTELGGAEWAIRPQSSGDLGERMGQFFEHEFATGATGVVVIGADCPEVDPETLRFVTGQLARFDVILGPARDGGYYLIGMRSMHWELFRDIPWSTPDVLAMTLERITHLGLTRRLLDEKPDVDDFASLQQVISRLQVQPRNSPQSRLANQLQGLSQVQSRIMPEGEDHAE